MTDSFQITEAGDRADSSLLPINSHRIEQQLAADITVIVGNPPYSVGQSSANDNNANLKYPTLDGRIADTYAARSTATNKNSLYDSYIRAYRWATDRLADRGIVAYVSNGGWLDGNTADGMRLSMADDFSSLWVFNLRGNAAHRRRASRKERRQRLRIRQPQHRRHHPRRQTPPPHRTRNHPLPRHRRLPHPRRQTRHPSPTPTSNDPEWIEITPNAAGDWLNQRDETFQQYTPIGDKNAGAGLFSVYSSGLKTNRDAWCYNFSATEVEQNMRRMIDTYNDQAVGESPTKRPRHDPSPGSAVQQLEATKLARRAASLSKEASRSALLPAIHEDNSSTSTRSSTTGPTRCQRSSRPPTHPTSASIAWRPARPSRSE